MGMKLASSTNQTATVVRAYLVSAKDLKPIEAPSSLFKGSRVLIRRLATISNAALRRAIIRFAHSNPIFGLASMMMTENSIPPTLPAVVAMPVARPLRTLNQWPTTEAAGVNRADEESPPRTLNDRKI